MRRTEKKTTWWNDNKLTSSNSCRAAVLQYQWQEVSERERIAKSHNRKLLQDFQRAQETLSDLVARTEAINSIRAEYETYLEEKFPQWQQKLRDKRLSEQHKRMDQHLSVCREKMEEEDDQRNVGGNKPQQDHVRVNSPALISPNPCHCPVSYSLPCTSEHRDKRTEALNAIPRSTLSHRQNKPNMPETLQNSIEHHFPFTWLTQCQPLVRKPLQSKISKTAVNFHNVHEPWTSSFLSPYQLSSNPLHRPYSQVQHCGNSLGEENKRLKPRLNCPSDGACWSDLPKVNPLSMEEIFEPSVKGVWCWEEEQTNKEWGEDDKIRRRIRNSSQQPNGNHQLKKQRRTIINSGTKPDCQGDLSESIALSSAVASEVKRRRNSRRIKTQINNKTEPKDLVSSSDNQSIINNKNNRAQLLHGRRSIFKSSKDSKARVRTEKSTTSPVPTVKTYINNGCKKHETEKRDFKNEEVHQVFTSVEDRLSGITDSDHVECKKDQEETEGSRNKEQEMEKLRNSLDAEEAEEQDEHLRSSASVEECTSEKLNSERQSEVEEGKEVQEEKDDVETRCEEGIDATERRDIADNDSVQEGNDGSRSERNIDDSLKELYKDDTEDELNYQESEDDTEEEDDVVVGKVTPCLFDPIHNDTVYQDHDDDEVEGLLAPQNNSWRHRAEEPEEAKDKPKGDSEDSKDELHRKTCLAPVKEEPDDSDDEFDHFYD